MVTLVVCENKNKHIGSRRTDVTTTTNIFAQLHKKEILMNGYNYHDNLLALFFLLEEELVSKIV